MFSTQQLDYFGMLGKIPFRWLFFLAMTVLTLHRGIAQTPNEYKQDFSTPSPTVASLGKFGLTPVAYYTGVPQVSIPIWEVQGKQLQLPISLSYNNNGFKVMEDASWVGLGWALQAGGMITQNIQGNADDLQDAGNCCYGSSGLLPFELPDPAGTTASQPLMNRIAQGIQDKSPDIFIFNFGKYSGRFVLYNTTAYQFLYQDLKITYDYQAHRFTIVTGDGTIYRFFKRESTFNENLSASNNYSTSSSWLLTEIISADGSDTITLTYTTTPEQYVTATGTTFDDYYEGYPVVYGNANQGGPCSGYSSSPAYSNTHTILYRSTATAYRLLRIESQSQRIEFVPQTTKRSDVNGTAYALARIEVYDKFRTANTPVCSFNLQLGYFSGAPTPLTGRLKLNSIQKVGEGGVTQPPYTFEYQEIPYFPDRYSRDLDHWGYYNAAGNNSLVPATLNYTAGTANREPDFQATLLTTLQKITYPTGGFESFTYEQNRYIPEQGQPERNGPGLRVQQIMSQAANGVVSYRRFSYVAPIDRWLAPHYEKALVNNPGTLNDCMKITVMGRHASIFSMFASVVYYERVTESLGQNGEGGQTEYQFQRIIGPYDHANGMVMTKKIIRTAGNQKVREEENSYATSSDLELPVLVDNIAVHGPYIAAGCGAFGMASNTLSGYTWFDALYGPINNDMGCYWPGVSCGCSGYGGPWVAYKEDPTYGFKLSYYYPAWNPLTFNWHRLSSATVRTYDSNDAQLSAEVTTRYFYDQSTPSSTGAFVHRYVTREETTDSQGPTRITRKRYPEEYNTSGPTRANPYYNALQRMVALHQVNAPVEQLALLKTGNVTTAIGGQLTLYKGHTTVTNIHPAMVLNLETDTPLPDATFSASNNSYVTWDSHFVPRLTYDYSEVGKLLQAQPSNDVPTSYIWGADNTRLIAEVKNATPGQIAFTSFEANSTGGWTYDAVNTVSVPFTGKLCFGLGGSGGATVLRAGLGAGTYELLLWAHGTGVPQLTGPTQQRHEDGPVAGDWHQHRYYVTMPASGSLTISTPAYIYIDEVRLHPTTAQMTSYTHEPLSGMTSQTDANGRTITYEYDGLQRLHLVRDQELNILQKYDYHYKP
jgi:hypothetical protein